MKKPIIVLVIPGLQGGGVERIVLNSAAGFEQQGCDVHIVLILKKDIKLEFGSHGKFQIHRFKYYYRWIPRVLKGLIFTPLLDKFIIKKCGNPDLVLSSSATSDRVLCNSKLNNVYMIIQNTLSQDVDKNWRKERAIYTKKPIICCSQGVKEDFDKLFDSRYSSYCIYNPIDVNFVKKKSTEFRPKYKKYLVNVARFEKQKRHDILIRAYHQSNLDEILILVGDGSLQKKCKKLVNDLNLNKKVIFIGSQLNPYPFMKYAKLMVMSSDFEGLPTVILDSLSLGVPVISTDCPSGPSEMLPKNNLTPVGDITALANKMIDATKTPLEYVSDFKDEFHIENQIKKYLALINK